MKYEIPGNRTVMSEHSERDPLGRMRVRYLHWVATDNILGAAHQVAAWLTAAAVMVELQPGRWLLQHVLVADDDRRRGIAEQIVLAMEQEHGEIGAAWVSATGEAFARRFMEKHGPRPTWQLGVSKPEDLRRRVARVQAAILRRATRGVEAGGG